MNILSNSKSILAKLLAEENISVQHKKIPTAYFDVKNRVLACPIWADMSADLYDLLMGHEVGHALYTPAEGWHNAITSNLKDKPGFKSYLNVIEDARIEKMIKSKFPGMRKPFYTAYGELFDKGFFGLTAESYVEDLPLIDRINLYYKVGPFVGVDFTEEEAPLVALVENAKTWDDVVAAAHKIYEYGKQEAPRLKEQEYGEGSDEEGGEQQELDLDDLEGLAESEEMGDAEAGETPEGDGKKKILVKGAGVSDPESLTDKAFRAKEKNLVDPSSRAYAYANLPTFDLKGRIIPFKTVYENMKFYEEMAEQERVQNLLLSLFKKKNEKYIGYLVKEFELRKNARQFARAAVSTTGKLDMKKIHNYKTSEDLFRKMTIVPQGKNHGLLMFLDLSGSMVDNMRPTLEQTLILATFCRKVNIPFTVYGFSDSHFTAEVEHLSNIREKRNEGDLFVFQSNTFRLREYLSSSMNTKQFIDAQKKLLYLAECHGDWSNAQKHSFKKPWVPESEKLNGTPLDDTIVAAMQVSKNFKQALKLDVVSIIFLTNGEGSQSEYFVDGEQTLRSLRLQNPGHYDYSLVVTDPKTKLQGVAEIGEPSSAALLRLLKAMTGFNVIGFFLMGHRANKILRSYVLSCGTSYKISAEKAVQDYRKNGYFAMVAKGYDAFYMLPGGRDLEIGDESLKVAESATKTEIKKAFKDNLTQKSVNRVFLTRFAEMIA